MFTVDEVDWFTRDCKTERSILFLDTKHEQARWHAHPPTQPSHRPNCEASRKWTLHANVPCTYICVIHRVWYDVTTAATKTNYIISEIPQTLKRGYRLKSSKFWTIADSITIRHVIKGKVHVRCRCPLHQVSVMIGISVMWSLGSTTAVDQDSRSIQSIVFSTRFGKAGVRDDVPCIMQYIRIGLYICRFRVVDVYRSP